MNSEQINNMFELFDAVREGTITDDQYAELDEILSKDKQACKFYLEYFNMCAILRKGKAIEEEPELIAGEDDSLCDMNVWSQLAQYEKTAPTLEIKEPELLREPVKMLKIERSPRTINKFSLYSAIISMAAVVFLLLYIKFVPPAASTVASIIDSMNAQWAQSDHPTDVGDRLWDNQGSLWLQKGTVKIAFDYGAEVIIEGPAEFELKSQDKMLLNSGRLYAVVPKGATGFTVQTPYSTVIDLGTEFGVEVDFDGSTDVHMFTGKASLIPGRTGEKQEGLELIAGQAKAVTQAGQVRDITLKRQAFVCKLNSQTDLLWRGEDLDLADLVGGGNGFGTGRIGCSINPDSGQMTAGSQFDRRGGGDQYVPVVKSPFIDGVFVPDGGQGPVQVSSQNHTFQNCPDTINLYYADIINGGRIMHMNNLQVKIYAPLVLGEQQYGTSERSALSMHANLGITFDLAAIRQLMPDVEISAFTSLCGMSEMTQEPAGGTVDFHVLVDGQVKYQRKAVRQFAPAGEININLTSADRFLTLIATDGGDNYGNDYSFFAEPVLVLEKKIH